jgi:DNA topoisomerase-1
MVAQEKFTQKPARYSEASLVKKMEELGIGRPSTYASTISTIQARTYVVKQDLEGKPRSFAVHTLANKSITSETRTENTGAERAKLFPTDIGRVVNDFLVENFKSILDYAFTANVEEEFDIIAEGNLDWKKMLRTFYNPFHENVNKTMNEAARASGERLLGTDPASGKPIIARIGRFGPMIQLGTAEEEEKKFASLRPTQSINTITLEEALDLFKMPRNLGEWNGEKIVVGIGRFGPYVQMGESYNAKQAKEKGLGSKAIKAPMASIPKDKDITSVSVEDATKYLSLPRVLGVHPVSGKEILANNGRFGPYVMHDGDFRSIKAPDNVYEINLERALAIIAEPKKPRGFKKKAK